ncbi:MAG: hypothetical protein N2512_05975, partial [Armatimonadetes bacterium]|nr:hypothetical protein [Armatimonadota bacterium]
MRTASLTTIGLVAAALVGGCVRPAWEVRTFHHHTPAQPNEPFVITDSTLQQNMSKVRGRWVCSYCGYSTNVVSSPSNPGRCPDPWNATGHPVNAPLEYRPVDESFYSISPWSYVVGLPFHPKTGSNADGSIVHAAAAGLLNNPNVMAGDYVRFLFLMPGA